VGAERLVAVLLLLQARGRMTAADLARRLETSERTVRRDLEALSVAGVPVHALRGRGGGWELMEGYRTHLTGLTPGEAEALFAIAGPPGVAAGLGLEPPVRSALRKVLAALPAPARRQAEAAGSRILVDPTGWDSDDRTPPLLAELRRATIAGVQVDLDYAKRGEPPVRRRVHPYGLVAKAGTWYLMGGTEAGVRTYRVSRVRGVEPTGLPVTLPEGWDLEAEWARVRAGVPGRFASIDVVLRVDADAEPHLRRAFAGWAEVDVAVPADGDPWPRLSLRVSGLEATARELARFTGWVEVLEPPELRAELGRLGAELRQRYEAAGPPA
jgi:predicted DNA-binding transcriptional regulator YafY